MLCWNYCRPGWSPGTRDAPRSPGRATPGGSRGPGPEGLRRLPHQAARRRSSCPALGARAEILVAGGSVLAGPLVELLALVAPAAVHVKAQAACLVLELIRAIGLACRQPETGRGAARRLLDDVRGAGRRARGRHVSTGVAGLELTRAPFWAFHCWLVPPLQAQSSTGVPLLPLAPVMSRQPPSMVMVPLVLTVQFWAGA